MLQDAALVTVESAPLPNAYENTIKPNSSFFCLTKSKSSVDSPSVRNKIAFRHPEVFVPTVVEFSNTSYAFWKASVKLVPPTGPRLSMNVNADELLSGSLLASVMGCRSKFPVQMLAIELNSITVA